MYMCKAIFVLQLTLLLVFDSFSQKESQYYSTIEKKDKIVLNDDHSFDLFINEKVTVLNELGLRHAVREIDISDRVKIKSFEAIATHPITGKTIKKYKYKDLNERTYLDDVSIYTDTKIMTFVPSGISPPYIIEFKIEKKSQDNFFIQSWYPGVFYKQKVTSANLEVNFPEVIGLRYRLEHAEAVEKIQESESLNTISWDFSDLPILKPEDENIPKIALGPIQVKLGNYISRLESWEKMGQFINLLNQGKDDLPEEFKILVHQMVEGIDDDFDKMAVLYKYIQDNYRYVAISLGIGGWEPRSAADVINTKYGECKALTILLKGMLKEVGIESQYTLVSAGDDYIKLKEDFPQSSCFNHAFLRVPLNDDVYWLEATSRTLPAGFSGDFTKGRNVLVITSDGGVLEKTPDYADFKFNTYSGDYHIDLNTMGDGVITGTAKFDGFLALPFIESQYYKGEKELKINLIEGLNANNLFLKSMETSRTNQRNVPQVSVNFDGFYQKYAQQTGKRIILPGNLFQADIEKFDNDVFRAEESIIVKLETGFEIESGGGKQVFENEYFTYTVEVIDQIDQISINNILEVTLPKDSSKELKSKTLNELNQLSKQSIILKKL